MTPFVPVDLIIDHSVQVDHLGSADSYPTNLEWDRRNRERYALPPGTTATDLVLTMTQTQTQMLRAHGVVGKFVEFFGPELSNLGIADAPHRGTRVSATVAA